MAGREHRKFENVVGLFVNAGVIRYFPQNYKTFSQFLNEVRESTIKAYENQDYPFGDLVETLKVGSDISRNPLYDAELIIQNMEPSTMQLMLRR